MFVLVEEDFSELDRFINQAKKAEEEKDWGEPPKNLSKNKDWKESKGRKSEGLNKSTKNKGWGIGECMQMQLKVCKHPNDLENEAGAEEEEQKEIGMTRVITTKRRFMNCSNSNFIKAELNGKEPNYVITK
ncbi:19614_t:CDS:2 [Gigaspora rosea]|nr:19614_t:CDS:2 [Gigaspora rosea]